MINRESRRLRVLQVGMTRNLGGIETYLIEQFRHLDKSKIDYDFVNITGEYSICYEDEILASGSKIFKVVSRHKNPLLHYWQWFNILLQNKSVYDVIVLNTNSLEYVFPLVLGKSLAYLFVLFIAIIQDLKTSKAWLVVSWWE